MNEANTQPKKKPLPHQIPVFEELLETAYDFSGTSWRDLAIRPRWHRLILGPTGSGKSELVRLIAAHLNWPLLEISVPGWIIMGAAERAGEHTWHTLVRWLSCLPVSGNNGNAILFLDEIDKVGSTDSWTKYLQIELFTLLDGRVPKIRMNDDTLDFTELSIPMAKAKLRDKVFIVGAGAFQDVLESSWRPSIGFTTTAATHAPASLELSDIAGTIPRELGNRFSQCLLRFTRLVDTDYQAMVAAVAPRLPPHLSAIFRRIGMARINAAVAAQKGTRYVEEVLTLALREWRVEEKAILSRSVDSPPNLEPEI